MTKPISIFGCGVQKGGTTSLHAFLSDHPALSPPMRKELHFFDDEMIDWRAPDYSKLDLFYKQDDGEAQRFEITPIYGFWPPSIGRIYRYNPSAKLIYLFRDPLQRAWSQWRMETARGDETLPFAAAIREGRGRIDPTRPLSQEHRTYTYVERGFYASQVRQALAVFPREQILFLRSEDLKDQHTDILGDIARFLEIDAFPETPPKFEHVGPKDLNMGKPSEADRELFAELLGEDLKQFNALTGLDVSGWMTAPSPAVSPRRHRPASEKRPNVLFIVADDLNSWIGALGRQPDIRTPAIDALARRGTLFTRAYCAAPYCNASRMSVFTGCLPTTTGVYANEPFWETPYRRKTNIEAFKEADYYTFGAGKVFHGVYDYQRAGQDGRRTADWQEIENRPYLWDRFETSVGEPLPEHRPLNGLFDFSRFEDVPPFYHHFDWGPYVAEDEGSMPDEFVCRSTEEFLGGAPREPFFCATGLYKPHLPWHVPRRFFDQYDIDKISLPLVRDDDLDDVPPLAKEWALSPADHALVTSRGQWRSAVQGYLAAISYCDWIVGRIIDALDRSGLADDTMVVLWGDNGFHLGEKLHWRKFVLWEEATRVPMIIVPPRGVEVLPTYDLPVSLIDLFPTMAELCHVEPPPHQDGHSLVKAMTRPYWPGHPVHTTWGQQNHSVRHGDWRYTTYSDGGEELYNHKFDPNEWTNLIGDPRFADQVQLLRRLVRSDIIG